MSSESASGSREPNEPKIITFYNFKGGIGKTTGLYILAWLLAKELGLRVLMVDADPQANLTKTVIKGNCYSPEASKDPILQKKAKDDTNKLVAQKLRELFQGDHKAFQDRRSGNKTLYQCLRMLDNEEIINMDIAKQVNLIQSRLCENLYLLPGSMYTARLEQYVGAVLWPIPTPVDKYTPGNIVNFIRTMAYHSSGQFDVVLIDLNPNFSALNHVLIGGCDYFVMPAHPDEYSEQSLISFGDSLDDWNEKLAPYRDRTRLHAIEKEIEEKKARGENVTLDEAQIERLKNKLLPQHLPRYLGLLVQRFGIIEGGEPIAAAAEWIGDVSAALNSLLEKFKQLDMLSAFGQFMHDQHYWIEDFCSVGKEIQHTGYPVSSVFKYNEKGEALSPNSDVISKFGSKLRKRFTNKNTIKKYQRICSRYMSIARLIESAIGSELINQVLVNKDDYISGIFEIQIDKVTLAHTGSYPQFQAFFQGELGYLRESNCASKIHEPNALLAPFSDLDKLLLDLRALLERRNEDLPSNEKGLRDSVQKFLAEQLFCLLRREDFDGKFFVDILPPQLWEEWCDYYNSLTEVLEKVQTKYPEDAQHFGNHSGPILRFLQSRQNSGSEDEDVTVFIEQFEQLSEQYRKLTHCMLEEFQKPGNCLKLLGFVLKNAAYFALHLSEDSSQTLNFPLLNALALLASSESRICVWYQAGDAKTLLPLWFGPSSKAAAKDHHLLYKGNGQFSLLLKVPTLGATSAMLSSKPRGILEFGAKPQIARGKNKRFKVAIEGEERVFEKIAVSGEGNNCFFNAIGVTRQEFSDQIRKNLSDEEKLQLAWNIHLLTQDPYGVTAEFYEKYILKISEFFDKSRTLQVTRVNLGHTRIYPDLSIEDNRREIDRIPPRQRTAEMNSFYDNFQHFRESLNNFEQEVNTCFGSSEAIENFLNLVVCSKQWLMEFIATERDQNHERNALLDIYLNHASSLRLVIWQTQGQELLPTFEGGPEQGQRVDIIHNGIDHFDRLRFIDNSRASKKQAKRSIDTTTDEEDEKIRPPKKRAKPHRKTRSSQPNTSSGTTGEEDEEDDLAGPSTSSSHKLRRAKTAAQKKLSQKVMEIDEGNSDEDGSEVDAMIATPPRFAGLVRAASMFAHSETDPSLSDSDEESEEESETAHMDLDS